MAEKRFEDNVCSGKTIPVGVWYSTKIQSIYGISLQFHRLLKRKNIIGYSLNGEKQPAIFSRFKLLLVPE